MPNSPPAVDLAALGVTEADVGRETLIELITLFLTDGGKQIATAREAAAAGRAEKVRSVAHRLKSMSYYLGARSLSSLCAEIEAACAEGRQPDLPTEVQRLETLFGQVKPELEAYAAGRP
jgi:HPt (histidine-containing phosphotransfer) domain-containing protein